jgi:hypothetical protein
MQAGQTCKACACIDGPADSEDRSQPLIGELVLTHHMSQLIYLCHRPRDLHVTFFASLIILGAHCTLRLPVLCV